MAITALALIDAIRVVCRQAWSCLVVNSSRELGSSSGFVISSRVLTAARFTIGPMKLFRQSSYASFVIGAIALSIPTISVRAATPDEQAVLVPVNAMFDAMAKRDASAIKEPLLPGGTMVLMRDGKPTQMTFEAFADRVGKPGTSQIAERIHDPLVRIDNDLAVVWAPFEFLVNGKVDHCGTDLFNLIRQDGKWLIASVADTGRKDCAGR
jgi:hypothetical protein